MIRSALRSFRTLIGCGVAGSDYDGFGQSIVDDLRYLRRFRQCRRRAVLWRTPTAADEKTIEVHPVLGRFGDATIAVAEVDGRHWIVRERDWHGWPDPPRYVFFANEQDGIWAAADFDGWPQAWQQPVGPKTFSGEP
ncbi:hypothetical protein [Sphingomonas sp.]|uniref:hypothetical protein n=1 Tax=Sphingomonas sp. TaxID=28214 RepID=UPI003B3A07DF